jgi:signal transduction histidine kinase
METLYFILGALSVVTLIAVVSVFKIRKEMDQMVEDRLDQVVNHLSNYIEKVERYSDAVESRIDSEVNKLNEYVDQLHDNTYKEMDKLYGYVDSRTDKMADGVSKHIAEINQTLDSLTK